MNKIDYNIRLLKRFWDNVEKSKGCWKWTGSLRREYGRIFANYKTISVHRFSYELHCGKIPKNKSVLHTCDNPPCVNPKHLFLGTHKDNMRDMIVKGRKRVGIGEQSTNPKLTEEKVLEIRRLYKEENMTLYKIAEIFNVSFQNISWIINRKSWKHI